ncbi:hypothetical protein IFM89_039631 [Coptis chinensis]|uniref:NAD-dependent epimerase/dehydratase domain-containing protein n=1 Tax=Coptis chinensis TaxID=261450 RepID=A0A835GWB4_9MAGN|nr:hypothetical protein IFM89_039631 [Coptis chinensis]
MDQDMFKGKLCVTGASGYLASWLVKRLLLSGYHVKGTVRDPGNQKKLAHLWQLEGAKERLELVKDGVFHTASPVLGDPKARPSPLTCIYAEILDPAIKGTLNALRSCKKNPLLTRVILTSSSATVRVRDDFDPNVPLDESSWSSVELCERLQSGSLPRDLCSTASDVLGLLRGASDKFSWHGMMEGWAIYIYEEVNAHGRYLCSSRVLDNTDLVSFLAKRYPSLPSPVAHTKH